ncbi:MAG: FkbM family methyltransferase [Planctomycetota bacterium]|nr:FkbM family methyltransferase [Planctomycetota bacterium]
MDESWEIHAYEPNPECRSRERLRDFGLTVTPHDVAIWTYDGKTQLLQDNHRQSGSGSPNDGKSDADGWASCLADVGTRHPGLNTAIEVPCEDLSRLFAASSPEDFVVVKMDIEGAKFAVLRHLIQQGTITHSPKNFTSSGTSVFYHLRTPSRESI